MPLQGAATRLAFAPRVPTGFYIAAGQAGWIIPAIGAGTVRLSCRGPGCGFKSYKLETKVASRRINLLAHLKRYRLRRGAIVTLRLARAGQVTTVIRWRVGPPTRRVTTCLLPGARNGTGGGSPAHDLEAPMRALVRYAIN